MEYTKGEWIADNGDSELWGVFEKETGKEILYIGGTTEGFEVSPNRDFEESRANAHLIAASPLMYEALKKLADLGRLLSREDVSEGNKALAKAEGKNG